MSYLIIFVCLPMILLRFWLNIFKVRRSSHKFALDIICTCRWLVVKFPFDICTRVFFTKTNEYIFTMFKRFRLNCVSV